MTNSYKMPMQLTHLYKHLFIILGFMLGACLILTPLTQANTLVSNASKNSAYSSLNQPNNALHADDKTSLYTAIQGDYSHKANHHKSHKNAHCSCCFGGLCTPIIQYEATDPIIFKANVFPPINASPSPAYLTEHLRPPNAA